VEDVQEKRGTAMLDQPDLHVIYVQAKRGDQDFPGRVHGTETRRLKRVLEHGGKS